MNIETITVGGSTYSSSAAGMQDYLHFGWQHTEDTRVRVGRGHRTKHILARDKDMPNYEAIVGLEGQYFNLKRTQRTYFPMEAGKVLLAFICFIIPGIIYVTVKLKRKKEIETHNAEIQNQMNVIVSKAKALL